MGISFVASIFGPSPSDMKLRDIAGDEWVDEHIEGNSDIIKEKKETK